MIARSFVACLSLLIIIFFVIVTYRWQRRRSVPMDQDHNQSCDSFLPTIVELVGEVKGVHGWSFQHTVITSNWRGLVQRKKPADFELRPSLFIQREKVKCCEIAWILCNDGCTHASKRWVREKGMPSLLIWKITRRCDIGYKRANPLILRHIFLCLNRNKLSNNTDDDESCVRVHSFSFSCSSFVMVRYKDHNKIYTGNFSPLSWSRRSEHDRYRHMYCVGRSTPCNFSCWSISS